MKKTDFILTSYLGITLLFLTSCTNYEEFVDNPNPSFVTSFSDVVRATVPCYNFVQDDTRSTLTPTSSGLSFTWDEDDQICIYTGEKTTFICGVKTVEDDPSSASFVAENVSLDQGATYYAISPCPANSKDKRSAVKLSYTGQKQKSNGSNDHLGDYDFMTSSATTTSRNSADFSFSHLNAVMRFELNLPAGSYTSLSVSSPQRNFISAATVNVKDSKITPTTTDETIMLKLGEDNGIKLSSGQKLTTYLTVAPVDMSASVWQVKVTSKSGSTYYGWIKGKNMLKGKAYSYSLSLQREVSILCFTDRHELSSNFRALLRQSRNLDKVSIPAYILDGGDNVCSGSEHMPSFSMSVVLDDINAVYPKGSYTFLPTFATHDNGCVDDYKNTWFTGPKLCDDFYAYGITSTQMIQSDEEHLEDKITNTQINDTIQDYRFEKYKTADVASAYFTKWVNSISDNKPIVIMSHVPMHDRRDDNHGAKLWFDAINKAAKTRTIIFLWGHNHTSEKWQDTQNYFLVPGDKMDVAKAWGEPYWDQKLNFYYMNAGYVKHVSTLDYGYSSVLTLFDSDNNNTFDKMRIIKFDETGAFGWGTDDAKPNKKSLPYTITLK